MKNKLKMLDGISLALITAIQWVFYFSFVVFDVLFNFILSQLSTKCKKIAENRFWFLLEIPVPFNGNIWSKTSSNHKEKISLKKLHFHSFVRRMHHIVRLLNLISSTFYSFPFISFHLECSDRLQSHSFSCGLAIDSIA